VPLSAIGERLYFRLYNAVTSNAVLAQTISLAVANDNAVPVDEAIEPQCDSISLKILF
jgi:hypothetical protein